MSMNASLVYVDDSTIHGKGLFARHHIKAGVIIGVDEKNGIHVQCELRFINHSDTPNAVYYDTLEVCALRDIKPGEEITHNYMGV